MKNKILKIIKWYFIYHFIIDLCFLVMFLYWYCTESDYIWYRRMMVEPSMIFDVLLLCPLIIISVPFVIMPFCNNVQSTCVFIQIISLSLFRYKVLRAFYS